MKFTYTTLILAVLYRRCVSATVDLWSSPLNTRDEAFDIPRNELIDPEELKARLGKPPVEYNPDERYAGMLGPGLSGHIGSVFVEPGAICRMAGGRAAIGEPPAESPLHVALMSVFVKTKQERPRRCFICVGKALTLAGDDGAVQDLIHEFYTSDDLTKHLRRKHLSNLRDGDKIQCHVCDMSLDHKMHLKNHALRVHGTVP
ncbi:hypothetical protein QQX98_007611 [Neonectria punicea]|uniref:C2H2-type domain-containing protein n=1 Tax=Neonectria punicea TaxID=979145 RepID=A0ABR1GXI4_9HYPO